MILKHEILSDEETKRLIKLSQNGNKEAKDELVEKNLRLVWNAVHRFKVEEKNKEDLFQIGVIGLMNSIDRFDFSFDVKFSTYAFPMIFGEIQRYLRDHGNDSMKISRVGNNLFYKISKEIDKHLQNGNGELSVSELSEILSVSEEDIDKAIHSRNIISMNKVVYNTDGQNEVTLMDMISDKSKYKTDYLPLYEAIDSLSEREKMVIELRFFKDKSQIEVAEILGVSQAQISRLEKKILSILELKLSDEDFDKIKINKIEEEKQIERIDDKMDTTTTTGTKKPSKREMVLGLFDSKKTKSQIMKEAKISENNYYNYRKAWRDSKVENQEVLKDNVVDLQEVKDNKDKIQEKTNTTHTHVVTKSNLPSRDKYNREQQQQQQQQQAINEISKGMNEVGFLPEPQQKPNHQVRNYKLVDIILKDDSILKSCCIFTDNQYNRVLQDEGMIHEAFAKVPWATKFVYYQNTILMGGVSVNNVKDYRFSIVQL